MSDLTIQNIVEKEEFGCNLVAIEQQRPSNSDMLKAYRLDYKKGKEAKKDKDYTYAYVYFKDALHYARLINWKEAIIYVILEIADIDLATKNYEQAYKRYMSCLNIALANDLNSIISVLYFKLSKFYSAKGNPNLSMEYNNRAIKSIGL